jgi:C1A family cysteine protease
MTIDDLGLRSHLDGGKFTLFLWCCGSLTNHLLQFGITDAFQQYVASGLNSEVVFYDNHPQWKGHDCGYGEHASKLSPNCPTVFHHSHSVPVTVVGYAHHTRVNDPCSGPRLYWIVQNSWGSRSGHGGYVYSA